MAKRYNVCVPRKYIDRSGTEKVHFWKVGTMFPMHEKDGFTLNLYTRVLPSEKLAIFVDNEGERVPRTGSTAEPPVEDDDIPF